MEFNSFKLVVKKLSFISILHIRIWIVDHLWFNYKTELYRINVKRSCKLICSWHGIKSVKLPNASYITCLTLVAMLNPIIYFLKNSLRIDHNSRYYSVNSHFSQHHRPFSQTHLWSRFFSMVMYLKAHKEWYNSSKLLMDESYQLVYCWGLKLIQLGSWFS